MSAALVSVVMPVRNGAKYLTEALDSIAAQDFKELEVIVVDDGSRDLTVEVAQRHSLSPRISSQPGLGIGAALNRGIALAQGPYLAFLDYDDIWPAGRLQAMLGAFEEQPDIDGVFGRVSNTDARLQPIAPAQPARLTGALLLKRAPALRVGPFRTDVAHAAIIDWTSRAEFLGLRFDAIDRLVLLRRIHGENLGIVERAHAGRDLLRVIRSHHERKRR